MFQTNLRCKHFCNKKKKKNRNVDQNLLNIASLINKN